LEARLVVLDLRDLEFIDSSAVNAIGRARQAARQLVLYCPVPRASTAGSS
jgi:anti-anti-sigma regulatory factor